MNQRQLKRLKQFKDGQEKDKFIKELTDENDRLLKFIEQRKQIDSFLAHALGACLIPSTTLEPKIAAERALMGVEALIKKLSEKKEEQAPSAEPKAEQIKEGPQGEKDGK